MFSFCFPPWIFRSGLCLSDSLIIYQGFPFVNIFGKFLYFLIFKIFGIVSVLGSRADFRRFPISSFSGIVPILRRFQKLKFSVCLFPFFRHFSKLIFSGITGANFLYFSKWDFLGIGSAEGSDYVRLIFPCLLSSVVPSVVFFVLVWVWFRPKVPACSGSILAWFPVIRLFGLYRVFWRSNEIILISCFGAFWGYSGRFWRISDLFIGL